MSKFACVVFILIVIITSGIAQSGPSVAAYRFGYQNPTLRLLRRS